MVTKADPASDAIIYFRHGNGIFTKVTRLSDHVKDVWFFGERLLFRSWLHHATYDLFLARQDGKMSGKALGLEIPPGHVLTSVMPFSRTLLVTATFRGNSELFSYRFRDRRTSQVDLPQHVFIYNVTPVDHRDGAIIDLASFQAPPHWDEYRSASPRMIYTGIGSKSGADYSGVIVKDVLVPSSDVRVKIPLTIVQLRSLTVRPSTPTVLTAYGAHGDIEGPRFLGTWLAWLEDGGVLAIAHVRGGGELGESWHTAATLRNKPISSNDLAECARWLAAHGYGSATHLGLIGNSTGAFLVALAITRNPDLYRGAVGESGLYDLLHSGNGDLPFFSNELGDASDNIQRKWLKAESPYLLVRKGIKYPSVFLSYGTNDDVTPPMNTRKLIASLEHSDASAVVLMRAYEGEGHGANIPYSNRVQHRIDELTFLHHVLR